MINVKQILEKYSPISNMSDIEGHHLVALVHAGLLEESKIPMLKRALNKNPKDMTMAEKKALHEVVQSVASCVIDEQKDFLSKMDTSRPMAYPSEKEIPTVLILKRKAIRVYPDNQKVALYYCQAIDKYISIPYGKNSKAIGMSLNEAFGLKTPKMTGKTLGSLSAKKGKSLDDALKMGERLAGKSNDSNPISSAFSAGQKWAIEQGYKNAPKPEPKPQETQTPTPKPEPITPVSQRSGAVTARREKNMPKSVSESFRQHLEEKREKQLNEVSWDDIKSGAKSAAEFAGDVTGVSDLYSAGKKAVSGDYSGAAWDAAKGGAKALTTIVPGGLAAKGAITGGKAALAAARAAGASRVGKAASTAAGAVKGAGKGLWKGAKLAGGALAAGAKVASGGGGSDSSSGGDSATKQLSGPEFQMQGTSKAAQTSISNPSKVTFDPSTGEGKIGRAMSMQRESTNINIIKHIVENNISHHDIHFGDNSIRVNNRIAKKVMKIYESLNKKNKRKVEKMLNEDANSFRKVINFAVQQ